MTRNERIAEWFKRRRHAGANWQEAVAYSSTLLAREQRVADLQADRDRAQVDWFTAEREIDWMREALQELHDDIGQLPHHKVRAELRRIVAGKPT